MVQSLNLDERKKGTAFKRILVATDDSKCSEKAVREAIRIAKCEGSELTILHVITIPIAYYSPDVREPIERAEEIFETRGEFCLEGALREAAKSGVEAKTALVEQMESPVKGIVDYAEMNKIDLIVIGTRGLGTLKGLIVGTVTSGVIRSAPCSVLVVR